MWFPWSMHFQSTQPVRLWGLNQLILSGSWSAYRGTKVLFARRDRERAVWLASAPRSRILGQSGIRNRDAVSIAMWLHHIASRPCTRMHALEHARRIIEMRCSWPSPPHPFPSSPFCLYSAISLLLPRSKRASLIMRETDSTSDQRILSAFDRLQVKRLKMDMEIPAGGRFNGSPYIIPRIPGAYPCLTVHGLIYLRQEDN